MESSLTNSVHVMKTTAILKMNAEKESSMIIFYYLSPRLQKPCILWFLFQVYSAMGKSMFGMV